MQTKEVLWGRRLALLCMLLGLLLLFHKTPTYAMTTMERLSDTEELMRSGTIERNYYYTNLMSQYDKSRVYSDKLIYEVTWDSESILRTLYIHNGTQFYRPGYYGNPYCVEGRLVKNDTTGDTYVIDGNLVSPTFVHVDPEETEIGDGDSDYTTLQFMCHYCVIEEGVTYLPRFVFYSIGDFYGSGMSRIKEFYMPDSLTYIDQEFMLDRFDLSMMKQSDITFHCSSTSYAARFAQEQGYNVAYTDIVDINSIAASKIHVSNVTYNGTAQTPNVTIDGLVKGTDYTLTYSNNTNVGTASVKITGKGRYNGSRTIFFQIAKANQTLAISADAQTLQEGQTTRVRVSGQKTGVTYRSSDSTIATVDSTGLVTAVKAGSVTITATASPSANYNGTSKAISIQVTEAPKPVIVPQNQSIKVSASATKISPKGKSTIKVTGAKGKVTYKSSNTGIATVSSTGVVTAKKIGTVKITVTSAATEEYLVAKKTITITVVPSATKITKLTSPKSGQMKVTWSKNTTGNYYEIQYSLTKDFKSAKKVIIKKNTTTSKTIKSLKKKKTYYVRVRCTDKTGKLVSKWSAVKSVKIKK